MLDKKNSEIGQSIFAGFLKKYMPPEGGLSLDLEPADKEPKNQNWLFWNMK